MNNFKNFKDNNTAKPVIEELKHQFLLNVQEKIYKIYELIKAKNYVQVQSLLHKIKGSSYLFDFKDIAQMVENLELRLNTKNNLIIEDLENLHKNIQEKIKG